MSMFLNVAVVPEAVFKKLTKDASLLEGLFFADDEAQEASALEALGLSEDDVGGCDYLSLAEASEAMDEALGEDGDDDDDDEENDDDGPNFEPTGTLDYDAGYDEAFYLAPKDLKKLGNDAWSLAAELDEDVKGLLARAKKQKLYVVGIIS